MSTLNVDKVDPSTGTALEIGTSGDTITVPSGATFVVAGTTEITGTNNVQRPNAQPLIINGDMAVAQRGTSSASITAAGYNTVDRFGVSITTAGTWTQTQEALTSGNAFADGFSTALKMDCTTADASLAAGDFCLVRYMFEGQDLQLLKKGTANAETMTVAFWIKATKTGTNIVALYDADNSRVCCGSYTVSVTNTWEFKVVNIAADTSGVLDNDNAKSIYLDFGMAAGTNYTSGTLPTAWESWVAADWFVGQVNHADSTSNNFHITGVQLEVGTYTSSTIPPFQHESYGNNLARCQRYYLDIATETAHTVYQETGVYLYNNAHFPTTMRAAPTATLSISAGAGTISSSGASSIGVNTAIIYANMAAANGRVTCASQKWDSEL